MWNQSNEWLVPLQHDQDSLLDVCALIFALDSLQTINSVCVDPPFVWYLCILDLSVHKKCCTEPSHGSWLLERPGLPAVPMLRNHRACGSIQVTENVLCSWLLHAECVWCMALLDTGCAQHVQGMLVLTGRVAFLLPVSWNFSWKHHRPYLALSSHRLLREHVNAGSPTSGMTIARVTANI